MSHKILVAQGGGPTAVINQSLAGVALEARRFPDVTHVYGALQGVRGIVNDDLVDLGQETVANLEAVAATPAAALGSTRDKPDPGACADILAALDRLGPSVHHRRSFAPVVAAREKHQPWTIKREADLFAVDTSIETEISAAG